MERNGKQKALGSQNGQRVLPPDPDEMNDSRAEWAAAALAEFCGQTGADLEDAVCDLLADLMHWCDRNEQSFDDQLSRAQYHYECETDRSENDCS